MMCFDHASWELPKKIMKEVVALLPYLKNIEWLGGEVFLYRQFEELFGLASVFPHLNQQITTNGLLLNEDRVRKILGCRTEMRISVDGITRRTYEHIRRGASFDDLLEKLELVRKVRRENANGPSRVCLNFVVMRSNYKEAAGIMDFARKFGFDHVSFLQLYNNDPEIYEKESIENDSEAIEFLLKLMPEIEKKSKECGITYIHFPVYRPAKAVRYKRYSADERGIPGRKCRIPWDSIEIAGEQVRPFCQCRKMVGTIPYASLAACWNSEGMQEYRRRNGSSAKDLCPAQCMTKSLKDRCLFD